MPGECICNQDYSGSLCQIDEDVCGHQTPCRNGGVCVNNGPDNYMCQCPSNYTGFDCQEETNFCEVLSPCLNGAICQVSALQLVIVGYTGVQAGWVEMWVGGYVVYREGGWICGVQAGWVDMWVYRQGGWICGVGG